MSATDIQWTDAVWNPCRGCAILSEGCRHCYAMRMAHRFSGKGQPYEGLTVLGKHGPRWTGSARFIPEKLAEPLSWRKPKRVFVNSMSDLFHDDITDEQIAAVFGVMAATPHITYQVLTKRAERLPAWFEWVRDQQGSESTLPERVTCYLAACREEHLGGNGRVPSPGWPEPGPWPLPNVHLGVSVENQDAANERLPHLLDRRVKAAVRWVSAEPLLGPVRFDERDMGCVGHLATTFGNPMINWIVVGGESGPGARPCDVQWIRSIVEQCEAAGVACFAKQLGANVLDRSDHGFDGEPDDDWPDGTCCDQLGASLPHQGAPIRVRLRDRAGGDMSEWPHDLRVRQWPEAKP